MRGRFQTDSTCGECKWPFWPLSLIKLGSLSLLVFTVDHFGKYSNNSKTRLHFCWLIFITYLDMRYHKTKVIILAHKHLPSCTSPVLAFAWFLQQSGGRNKGELEKSLGDSRRRPRPHWRVTNQLCSLGFIALKRTEGVKEEENDRRGIRDNWLSGGLCTHLSTLVN